MKTTMKARMFMGSAAIIAAFGVTACGAEGPESEAEIGSASEALHGTAPTVDSAETSANDLATGLKWGAHCKLHDATANKDYFVLAGGLLSTGAVTNQVLVREASGAWASAGSTLQAARSDLAYVQDPSDASTCYVAGGEDASGNASNKVDKIHVDNATWTISNGANMAVARSRFALATCGSGLIAIGGFDNAQAGAAKYLTSIESSQILPTGASESWSTTNALTDPRMEFAFVKSKTADKYIVAGGYNNGTYLRSIEQITTTVSSGRCSTTTSKYSTAGSIVLSAPVAGPVAFPEEGTADRFVITGGVKSDGSMPTTIDLVTVDFSTPANTTKSTPSLILAEAVYRPIVVGPIVDAGFNNAWALVGGGKFSASPSFPAVPQAADTASAKVQIYQSGQNPAGANPVRSVSLVTARFGASALLFSGPKVLATAGQSVFGGSPAFALKLEKINP